MSDTAAPLNPSPIGALISVERTAVNLKLASKKRALETLSELLATTQANLTTEEVFSCLLKRERLGSTGVGHSVGLPHGRLQGLDTAAGAFITLAEPVDYQAADELPVGVLFAMIVPEDASQQDLDTLTHLADMFTSAEFVEQLRAAEDSETAHRLLTETASGAA